MLRRLTAFLSLGLLLAGCAPSEPQGPLVLAAASTQEVMEDLADLWEHEGNPRPRISFSGSGILARQVQDGAPADLVVLANEDWGEVLQGEGLLRDEPTAIASNRLVLIAPSGDAMLVDPADASSMRRALGDGRMAMADPEAAPAGTYGKAALQSLGSWDAIADRLAIAENVRAALQLVGRGEAPLGLVYASDARAAPGVAIVAWIPRASHPPIRYTAAATRNSDHPDAGAFLEFLSSARGTAVFERHGFLAPE